jgi:xylan 1,4-beta-xylosidase
MKVSLILDAAKSRISFRVQSGGRQNEERKTENMEPTMKDRAPFPVRIPRCPFHILMSAVAGLPILTCAHLARGADASLAVDAAQVVSALPRPWTGAVGTGTASLSLRTDLQTQFKIVNRELGMQRVRGHGILNDDVGVFHWTGGTAAPTYDWTKFDTILKGYAAAGMRPIMELTFTPMALARATDAGVISNKNPPSDLQVYSQFIEAVVQHCVDTFGADDVKKWYWEVWNEPDYPGFWTATQADYLSMYGAAVSGATMALPDILIGGPATTYAGPWVTAFLQYTKSTNTRVSFVSSHGYGAAIGPTADPNGPATDVDTRAGLITGGGYSLADVKSLNTEFNSTYGGQGGNTSPNCVSMDSNVNASFIVKTAKLVSDRIQTNPAKLDVISYWTASDIFDEGSYIQNHNGLPFGQVFGLMNYQGIRKASFNGFKMLSYLGPKRLRVTGGTGTADGIDALAAVSDAGDEVQVLVYNYSTTIDTTGSDNATVTVNNLPFAGKPIFVTQFIVDPSHSNPYGVWLTQNKPAAPTEAQWQAMRQAQHLALAQPVSTMTAGSSYTTTFALPSQSASLIILGTHRPLTGRNALVDIEGEDYDGQSGATKEDSNDTSLGQSIAVTRGSYVFFDNVDFTDAGVTSLQLRVAAQNATTLELHPDSQTGPLLGTCAIAATGGAWATQKCTLSSTASGVHSTYLLFGGAMRLNSLVFEGQANGETDGGATPGNDGGTGTGGSGGANVSSGNGGSSGTSGGGGMDASSGNGGSAGSSGGGVGGSGLAGSSSGASPGKSGCSCRTAKTGQEPGLLVVGLVALALGALRRRGRAPWKRRSSELPIA